MRLEFSIHIERTPRDVFGVVANLENDTKWQQAVLEARKLTPGPIAVGTRFRHTIAIMGATRQLEIEFSLYHPERLFVIQCATGALVFRTDVRFVRVREGTRLDVLVAGAPTGLLRSAAVTLSNHRRREIDKDLRNLKRLMEASTL
jgi:hypothetical protein